MRAALARAAIRGGTLLLVLAAANYVRGALAQAAARRSAPRETSSVAGPREGELVARLAIPRLDADLAVFEGTSDDVLQRGPGHLSGTALPGGAGRDGNCVIAGHRDSFFRGLGRLRPGDVVRLRTVGGERVYRIRERRIVAPSRTSVAAPGGRPLLTLITCYPFDWIGSAPYRLVLVAEPVAGLGAAADGRGNARTDALPESGALSLRAAGRWTKATDTRSAAKTSVM